MTVQHFVHEPQDFPGAMGGIEATFPRQSSPGYSEAGETRAPTRLASLGFASLRDMNITRGHRDLIA